VRPLFRFEVGINPANTRSPSWTTQRNAALPNEMTDRVRVVHPFHPLFGREIDLVVHRSHWGKPRVFFRDSQGFLTSMPAAWTSVVPEDPCVALGAGRSAFRARDLLELAALISELRP
jgi:hypothetical protein